MDKKFGLHIVLGMIAGGILGASLALLLGITGLMLWMERVVER